MTIHSIVEGHGEVEAVPVLLRKLLVMNNSSIRAGRAIRLPRSRTVQESGVRDAVKIALKQPDCGSILILLDADDDCPKDLAPKLSQWAQIQAGKIPCEVVLANREYEAWFLASVDSLREKYLLSGATIADDVEKIRGAKERLQKLMPAHISYIETKHQAAMTEYIDLQDVHAHSRSFRKLIKAFGRLCAIPDVKLTYSS